MKYISTETKEVIEFNPSGKCNECGEYPYMTVTNKGNPKELCKKHLKKYGK